MTSKVQLKPVKTKFYPKKFLQSEKIQFGQQVDPNTGEIIYKEFQVTAYVADGLQCDYEPKAGISLKFGNQSWNLLSDDFHDLEGAFGAIASFIAKKKPKGNQVVVNEKNAFYEKKKALRRTKSDLELR